MIARRAWFACAWLLLGCSSGSAERVEARVECAGNAREPTIDCVVEHVAGKSPARVCWDLRYECKNQKVVRGTGFCLELRPSTHDAGPAGTTTDLL